MTASERGPVLMRNDIFGDGRLVKEVFKCGAGELPVEGDTVTIHYEMRLENTSEVLDSSRARGEPFEFVLGQDEVIKGWEHGVATMLVGEQAQLTIHPDFGYGRAGVGGPGGIPAAAPGEPGAKLCCDLELLSVNVAKDEGNTAEETIQSAMRLKDIGNSHFKSGNLDKAMHTYKQALDRIDSDPTTPGDADDDDTKWRDPSHAADRRALAVSCNLNLAQCLIKTEEYLLAVEHAAYVLKLQPDNSKALYRCGLARSRLGDLDRARAELLAAAKAEPRNAEVRKELDLCQRKLAEANKKDRTAFGSMFSKASLYKEKPKAEEVVVHDLSRRVFLVFECRADVGPPLPAGSRLLAETPLLRHIEVALYFDTAPSTAEQFRLLCTGGAETQLCYRNAPVLKVKKGTAICAGTLVSGDGRGNNEGVADERLTERHSRRGLLSMWCVGEHSHGLLLPEFLITLGPAPGLDGKRVVFGEVVSGWEVLDSLESLDVDDDLRPRQHCFIADCGEVSASDRQD